jgi:hypothetical protein
MTRAFKDFNLEVVAANFSYIVPRPRPPHAVLTAQSTTPPTSATTSTTPTTATTAATSSGAAAASTSEWKWPIKNMTQVCCHYTNPLLICLVPLYSPTNNNMINRKRGRIDGKFVMHRSLTIIKIYYNKIRLCYPHARRPKHPPFLSHYHPSHHHHHHHHHHRRRRRRRRHRLPRTMKQRRHRQPIRVLKSICLIPVNYLTFRLAYVAW